ncbi:MAG: universal stress protein [Pseudomonadota bacterium]
MTFHTILVHVDDSAHAVQRMAVAASLARSTGAHLVGMAPTGISRFLYESMPPENSDPTLALHLDMLRAQARGALDAFSAQCAAAELPSYEARILDDEAGAGLSLQARAADLVVISQAGPDARALEADLPPYVITHSGRPVLLVPVAGGAASAGRRILVSWDGSREAARALQLALPLLRDAELVELAVFDVASGEHAVADALAADPLPWLARHGVTATLAVHPVQRRFGPQRKHEVGEALLGRVAALSADLLVMGAYGHSRFRESILGGVTRTMLATMTVPVLMAH